MKVRKLLAGFLSAAMVLGTMAFPVFAEETNTLIEVSDSGTLKAAVNNIAENGTIKFTNEITVTRDGGNDPGVITFTKNCTVDLNGQTLNTGDMLWFAGSAAVTFTSGADNGKIKFGDVSDSLFRPDENGSFSIENITFTQTENAKVCYLFNMSGENSSIDLKNCVLDNINTASYGGVICGNNRENTKASIENCQITNINGVAVFGGQVTVKDSEISATTPFKIARDNHYAVLSGKTTITGDTNKYNGNKIYAIGEDVTVDSRIPTTVPVATIGTTPYATLADAMNDLAANGGTLDFLQDIDGSNYTTPVKMTKDAVINSNGYSITDLKMPLVETTGDIKLIFNDVKIDKADILVKNGAYANGLGIAAFVCYKNLGTPDITFNNCEITNSKIIADEQNTEIRSAGFIGYYDGGNVTVNGGKVENTTIEAVNGVGAITAYTTKLLTVNGTVIKNNTITSKEDRVGKTIIAGSVIGTATVSAMSIKATVSGNNTTQNVGGTQTPVTTIYGRVINGAELTLEADSSFDKVPFNDGDAVKFPNGYALDPKDNTVKTLSAVLENNKDLTDKEITDIIEDVKVDTVEQAAKMVETIKAIDKDVQKEITPEKVEEIINAQATNTDLDEATKAAGFAMDNAITVSVAEKEDTTGVNVVLASGNNKVYNVTATENSVAVNETSTPVLIKIKTNDTITKVLHEHNGVVKELPFTQKDSYVMFTMNEISNVALVPAVTVTSGQAKLSFVPKADQPEGKAVYDVVLTGDEFATVKNFVSGDFVTTLTGTGSKPFEYVIEPINNEIVVNYDTNPDGTRKYHVNLNHFDVNTSYTKDEDATHENSVVIGTMTVEGYGAGSIVVSDIQMNKHDDTAENRAKEINTIAGESAIFDIAVPTRNLTVNVTFPNTVNNNAKAYQDMKVTISGGDLSAPITKELGNDVQGVHWNVDTYSLTEKLTLDKTYTVTVSGEGYRTARYNVTMTGHKTLNFWNNVKNNAEVVEVGKDESKKNVTFLAGELVRDNQINIYDLSAVVSYFGESNLATTHPEYVKYDLNRDGKIDSRDIAYVLVSWGK